METRRRKEGYIYLRFYLQVKGPTAVVGVPHQQPAVCQSTTYSIRAQAYRSSVGFNAQCCLRRRKNKIANVSIKRSGITPYVPAESPTGDSGGSSANAQSPLRETLRRQKPQKILVAFIIVLHQIVGQSPLDGDAIPRSERQRAGNMHSFFTTGGLLHPHAHAYPSVRNDAKDVTTVIASRKDF